jgi:hypothetical protein
VNRRATLSPTRGVMHGVTFLSCDHLRLLRFGRSNKKHMPVLMAERSKASTVLGRSNIGIACSNRARGMDVCPRFSMLSCVGRGLALDRSPNQGVLPNVYRIEKSIKEGIGLQRTVESHREKK